MNTTNGAAGELAELSRRQQAIDRLLIAEGAGHIVHDLPARADGRSVGLASRPWRLDPTPYLLSSDDFAWLEEAISRRMRMLEALLVDLYGERRLVAEGEIDPARLWSSSGYRLAAVGAAARRNQRRWLSTYAVDVVRRADGAWVAIADLTDAPVGLGYTLLDRNVITQVADVGASTPRPLDASLELMRRALVDVTDVDGPRVVVLTSGIDHPAYVEHSYMATQLGFNIVEGADLVVRERQLWLQTLGGLERVDVLYRRISDQQLDPLETNTYGAAGIPAVLLADETSTLAIANAHGSGVLQDPNLIDAWDRLGELVTGEETWLKMNSPATAPQGVTGIDELLGAPAERVPCFVDGGIVEYPMVLRFHAVATDDGVRVIPGANGRIIEPHDVPTVPTPCRAKDVWVLGHSTVPLVNGTARSAPQVDFITSVPTRAADSLYWLGRASERAEAIARATRVVATGAPGLEWDGRPTPAMELLAVLARRETDLPAELARADSLGDARQLAVAAGSDALEFQIGSMLAESASVREFLSATTGRVLAEMVDSRAQLSSVPGDVVALDALLSQLSAFGGLWSESVVRGPAWYFGDYAKRFERSLVALSSARMALRIAEDGDTREASEWHRGLESVLAANDSLVAYRRRHRSDVEVGAVLGLILHDERNPRSAAASIVGLVRNAVAIGWSAGVERLEAVGAAIAAFVPGDDPALLDDAGERLDALAVELTSTRLVAPPNPTLVRPRLVDPGAVA